MPFIPFTTSYLDHGRIALTSQERAWASSTLPHLGTGFSEVWRLDEPHVGLLLTVVQHMADFTMIVENYVRGRSSPRPRATMTDQRNFVQHSLMDLMTAQEIETQTGDLPDEQYEACRLAMLIYSFLVVFPFPPTVGLHEKVTTKLQRAILGMRTIDSMSLTRLELQLWILIMGALISVGLPQRQWYVRELDTVVGELQLADLDSVMAVLGRFLWHPKTSQGDGLELWWDLNTQTTSKP